VPDASLYLFDGYNLLHAGPFTEPQELVDALASFVATRGARGVVVFDGVGQDREHGPLAVRYAPHADDLLERLAAEHRERERVLLVSSDTTVLGTAGIQVAKLSSQTFFRDYEPARAPDAAPGGLADKLDPDTAARLERLRRGE
jgi:predicted RNA-binding protein with PIN domain